MDWVFDENMKPVQAGKWGNCTACCLRNLNRDMFCRKMRCYDEMSGNNVYWTTVVEGNARELLMGQPPAEMVNWFNSRSIEQGRAAATECMKRAHENEIQK